MFGQARVRFCLRSHSTLHSLYCLPKISHFLRNATPLRSFPSSTTTAPARFVAVAVSESKNKWREGKRERRGILPLSPGKHSVRQSDESALIWLNVAQSWQFTPSESSPVPDDVAVVKYPTSIQIFCLRPCLSHSSPSFVRSQCRERSLLVHKITSLFLPPVFLPPPFLPSIPGGGCIAVLGT